MTAPLSSEPSLPSASFKDEWATAAGISVLVAMAAASPFFFLGSASGHDIAFHLASWLDAAGQWKQGIVFPRWAEWANYGFGEPRFIFYPPLSWLFGALLGTLIRLEAAGIVFIICAQTLAGLSAYALLRRCSDSRWAALFGCGCFAMNPYALVIMYTRSDFAELLAVAFFPLLFLAALRLCGLLTASGVGRFRDVLAFALPFCAIWLSNAPAAVIATYSAAFVFAATAIQRRSWAPLAKGASGMLLGFGLASFYLIPAIYEQRWVSISGAVAGGLAPAENFLYAKTTDTEHDVFNHVASNIAVVLLVWAVLGAALAWRRKRRTDDGKNGAGALPPLTALIIAAAFLMLPASSLLWRFLPELRFVQFPWRLMSVLAICAMTLMSASAQGKFRWIWLLAATLVVAGCGSYLGMHTWWDTEDMQTLEAAMKDGTGFEGTDEYDPAGDDHTNLAQGQPRARFLDRGKSSEADKIVVDDWTAEYRMLRVISPQSGRVAIRLLDYPAWRVAVNGKRVALQHPRSTKQMIVPVPAGESRIEITFERTADRTIGGWISVLGAIGAMGLLAWERRAQQTTEA